MAWTPAPPAGNPATGYLVSWGGAQDQLVTGASTVIRGLTNGTGYHITVAAHNAAGNSASVTATPDPVTPRAAIPAAPTGVAVKAGNGELLVSWAAPTTPVDHYRVTTSPAGSGQPVTASGSATSATLTGLTAGTDYDVTVTVYNAEGGAASTTVGPYTPYGPPGAPTSVTASQTGASTASVSFAAAPSGGSPVTGYQVTATPSAGGAAITATGTGSPLPLSGLSIGTYTVTVTATNDAGTGTASAPASLTIGVTSTVSITGVSAGASRTLDVTLTVNPNGDTPASYCVVLVNGGTATPGSCSQINVGGLTAGVTYSVTAYAVVDNAASAQSAAVNGSPVYIAQVANSYGVPVELFNGPSTNDTRVGSAASGQTIDLVCQTTGSMVVGTISDESDIWDKLTNGEWIPDLYTNTPNIDSYSPGIAQC